MNKGIIRHICKTPYKGFLVGWVDDKGYCHEVLCPTKDDLVNCLDKLLGFEVLERS